MKKTRAVLLFALLLSFLAAALGLAEPIYSEDFSRGRSLKELGFSGFHPSFWTLDLKGRYMKGISPGGMGHAAKIYTPRFAASRRNAELGLEWKTDFLFAESRRRSEEELAVGLADNRGAVLYRLSISPTRHGKEEGFALAFYKAGRPREALLKKAFWKTPLPGWHTFRMIFAPPEAGGGIRVLGEGKEVLSLRDLTYLDFAGLRFAYRAAHRHHAVGIDDILVAGGEAPSADTVPPVTRHDYEHEHEWAREPVVIHLTAADEGSGVAATYYRINNGPVMTGTEIVLTADGIYEVSYWSVDNAGNVEEAKTLMVKLDATPPAITPVITPPANAAGWHKGPVTVSFTATDNLSGVVETSPSVTLSTEGAGQRVTGFAVDAAGNRAETEVEVNIDLTPPVILELEPNGIWLSATRPTIGATFVEELSGIAEAKLTLDGEEIKEGVLLISNILTYTPPADLTPGRHTVNLTLFDRAGNEASSSASFVIDPAMPPIPPDPVQIAPPLDRTAFTDLASATSFLYTGDDPIQKGVLPETIEPRRAAVIRGRVLTVEGSPLPGVTISVLDHPEYGHTVSRQDGCFDLAVNGGGPLTVSYTRPGYLPAQRQVNVPWQDYAHAPDVVMIKPDPQVTEVRMDSTELQVARGSVITDEDGTRQATLLIPPGTKLEGLSLATLHLRATEYTVGEKGPQAMPAELPPQVGYTYCVELSADEAEEVRFDRPVYFYVENFLNFPVGTPVPVGYYDREKGVWVPSANGRVIRIVGINDGLAQVDLNGSGLPALEEGLSQLGFTQDELRKLAELCPAGQSLWRVPITHFTPWDCNWPYGPPAGAEAPSIPKAICDGKEDSPCLKTGASIIELQNQVLRETIGITGSPFTLNYAGDRAAGRKAAYTLEIPLSKDQLPPGLKRIDLEIHIAGRVFTESFPPEANLSHTFTWDGKDAYGRKVQGECQALIRIGYVYDAVYYNPQGEIDNSFGGFSGSPIAGAQARQEITMWEDYRTPVGVWEARAHGLGGWTLDAQHFYDPGGKVLYLGDGSRRSAENISLVLDTIAGTGEWGYGGDGGQAREAVLYCPMGIALGPDGTIYIADTNNHVIRRIGTDGIITTIAGTGEPGYGGDGGPATEARLYHPTGIALGADGSIYIADMENNRVRRLGPDGIITTIAGTGDFGYRGDDGPATEALLDWPSDVAVGPDGSIYVAEFYNHCLRRIAPDGIITTVAGTGTPGYNGDGGPAIEARLYFPTAVDVAPGGSIYLTDRGNHRLRRVGLDGIITTVAGTGTAGYSGDGGPATEAELNSPMGVAAGSDGSIYLTDYANHSLRRIAPDGIITTVAGTGKAGYNGDNGPAAATMLAYPARVAVGPQGKVYITDTYNSLIRRISLSLPDFTWDELAIPSEDGGRVYRFDPRGKHLATIDTLTGTQIHAFHYDEKGLLIGIEDADGNLTTIERDSLGNPTAVVGPYGQRTTLTLDANGYLASVTNPAGETVRLRYTQDGLLTELIDPRGGVHCFAYDSLGRLVRDEDPAGGVTTLEREELENGYVVTKKEKVDETTELVTTYKVEKLPTGETRMTNAGCCGGPVVSVISPDGTTTITHPDGTVVTTVEGPDPRFGMQAPIVKEMTVKTPGGLTYTQTATRSVTLAEPGNSLSLETITDTVTINDRTYTMTYDAATRRITNTTPEGRQSFAYLDEKGCVIRTEVPGLAQVAFEYDERGRLVGITEGEGLEARVSRLEYNTEGYIARSIDPLGRVTSFEYDAAGRVIAEILPDGRRIPYTYDAHGNVTSITPPGRPAHTFTYTPVDLEETYNPPPVAGGGTNQTRYDYNLNRQVIQITRPDGKTIGFAYDTMGRLVTVRTPEGEIGYVYDATSGNLTDIIAVDGGALSYTYDGTLLTKVQWRGEIYGEVSVVHDNFFRPVAQRINGSNEITYKYDADGLLIQTGALVITRDPQTALVLRTVLGQVSDEVIYDEFGALQDYRALYNGQTLYSIHYETDPLGRVVSKTETIDGETHTYLYSYDNRGQLTEVYRDGVLTGHYEYDANGNRLNYTGSNESVIGVYDAQDRLLTYGSNSYEYTANGELVRKTTPEGTTVYSYDTLGNLRGVTLPDGTEIGYLLDGRNRRIGKKINGLLVQGFLYQDDLNPVAELDGAGNIIARFVYGTKPHVPAYMVKGGRTYRLISDPLGSVRLVVDVESGEVLQRLDYDEFGRVILDTNPGFQPFGFGGGIYDHRTGLVHFGLRDYDPQTGRWITKDPVGLGGGLNLYVYVSNDPVNLVDPPGLSVAPGELLNLAGQLGLSGLGISQLDSPLPGPGDVIGAGMEILAGGVAIAGGVVLLYEKVVAPLLQKMEKEIARLKAKKDRYGVQYALVARVSGCYPNVRGGMTYLEAGEVWKYGETTNPEGRYSEAWLKSMNLWFFPEFYGNELQIKIMEKIKLYSYFIIHGQLPPGNKVFR